MDEIIKGILDRKREGIDCTEDESAEIKMFLKNRKFNDYPKEIEELLPSEFGEASQEFYLDKNNKPIDYGMTVDAPEPNDSDNYNNEFTGEVSGFHGEYVTVTDADGDYFDIEPERLTISED